MSLMKAFVREAQFSGRDRSLLIWILVLLSLSSLSVWFGLAEVNDQKATIEDLIEADRQDRLAEASKLKDWGSAAYYSFHLTYDPPSKFAFAAMGQRDLQPWKHRIRMLALEGQIYERDADNPVLALVGRFDFAFLAAFIVPLVLIMLLYDLRVSERAGGRQDLLEATCGNASSLWRARAGVRTVAVFVSVITPLFIAGMITGSSLVSLLWAALIVFAHTALWAWLSYTIAAWRRPGTVILMSLLSIWLVMSVIFPASARALIDRVVPTPTGAEILLMQRETVNDAWDLPREETMTPFFDRHPDWIDYTPAEDGFEWPWYYAFQQVGDQRTEPITNAYREGRMRRERFAAAASLLSPPSLLERSLQTLAKTDFNAAMAYEARVRQFHAQLRDFYYPKFYRNEPFEKSGLDNLPVFQTGTSGE